MLKKLNEQKLQTENQKIQVKKALTQTNNNEQYSRRDNIKIYGLSLLPGDDCKSKVKNFLAKDLNIHVKDEEISVAHIVPRRIQPTNPGQAPQPPPIIVRFAPSGRDRRMDILKGRKRLKETGVRIYEDLTEINQGLINRLRNHDGIKSSWSINGKIYGLTENDKKIKFDPYEGIDEKILQLV